LNARRDLLKPSDYRRAFAAVRPRITPIQWRMLEAHFYAPDQTATAEELGLAAGYPSPVAYRITNAVYSALGRRLRTELQIPAHRKVLIDIFAQGLPRDPTHPHYRFVLRPPAVKALAALGWFPDDDWRAGTPAPAPASGTEGRLVLRLVKHRSRERSLRRAKIVAALAASAEHRLTCEVPGCQFDFEATYGLLGREFAEVHHLRPLADLDETTLADLAVVCANCHRMLHVSGDCLTLEELGRYRQRQ
jgi:hypothetical protein